MNIAILSDIHGNDKALEALILELKKLGIKKIFCLGDMVGYYYQPDRVFDLLSGFECTFIKGNHEEMLISMMDDEFERLRILRKYGSGHEMALKKLSPEKLSWIKDLPEFIEVNLDGLNVGFYHGAPQDKGLYLYPDIEKSILQEAAKSLDFVFTGHSHYPFVFGYKQSVLVNTGSVGQLREKGGMASWVILNTSSQTVQIRYTLYDTKQVVDEVQTMDPDNDYLWKVLLR